MCDCNMQLIRYVPSPLPTARTVPATISCSAKRLLSLPVLQLLGQLLHSASAQVTAMVLQCSSVESCTLNFHLWNLVFATKSLSPQFRILASTPPKIQARLNKHFTPSSSLGTAKQQNPRTWPIQHCRLLLTYPKLLRSLSSEAIEVAAQGFALACEPAVALLVAGPGDFLYVVQSWEDLVSRS